MEKARIDEINEFNPTHVAIINKLLDQLVSTPVSFTATELKEMIACPNSHLFLLSYDDQLAGMLSIGSYRAPTGRKWWIEDVVVDQAFRGKALGRLLIEFAIRYVGRQGNSTLMLTSNPKRMAANALYQSVGFQLKPTNVYKMVCTADEK